MRTVVLILSLLVPALALAQPDPEGEDFVEDVAPPADEPAPAAAAAVPTEAAAPQMRRPLGGRIPPDVVMRIVRAALPQFNSCYLARQKLNPTLRGVVEVHAIIDTRGDVESAYPGRRTSMLDKDVTKCVLAVFRKLKFPEPEGAAVELNYPIEFLPPEKDEKAVEPIAKETLAEEPAPPVEAAPELPADEPADEPGGDE